MGCWELKFLGSFVFTGCDGLALKAIKISERKRTLQQHQQTSVLLHTFSFVKLYSLYIWHEKKMYLNI